MNLFESFYYWFLSWIDRKNCEDETEKKQPQRNYIISSVFPDKETMDIAMKIAK